MTLVDWPEGYKLYVPMLPQATKRKLPLTGGAKWVSHGVSR